MLDENNLNCLQHFGTIRDINSAAVDDEEDTDELNEDGLPWFHVNNSGFPIDVSTWERMWEHASKIHPGGETVLNKIRDSNELQEEPIPQAPVTFTPCTSVYERIDAVQNYMKELQYNHTGTQFFAIKKNRPLSGLMDSAKEMIKESLPIKCLEAVVLGIYLTNGFPGVDRFPISFKSTFNGNTFRHVVLGIYFNGRYGALGMSRRSDLMDKPVIFKNLSNLISDYETAYKKYWHELRKVVIGTLIPHEAHSYESIGWRQLVLKVHKISDEIKKNELNRYARDMRNQPLIKTSEQRTPKKVAGSLIHKKSSNLKSPLRTKAARKLSKFKLKPRNMSYIEEDEVLDSDDFEEEANLICNTPPTLASPETEEVFDQTSGTRSTDCRTNYTIRI